MPKEMTLGDHAEAWWVEQGNVAPKKDSEDYTKMYEKWHEFAFKSFPEGETEE